MMGLLREAGGLLVACVIYLPTLLWYKLEVFLMGIWFHRQLRAQACWLPAPAGVSRLREVPPMVGIRAVCPEMVRHQPHGKFCWSRGGAHTDAALLSGGVLR